ncbi:hypothetical protein EYF80_018241 [Liparis tanakae]|uniref:Uncharacterized protein n=1 Tax=Liparis tanakae TaxID=230148 RepID=A0A4Z2I259_9TELE|nr:hypothetical protein EYF80_018241 [Liparis tanakae]
MFSYQLTRAESTAGDAARRLLPLELGEHLRTEKRSLWSIAADFASLCQTDTAARPERGSEKQSRGMRQERLGLVVVAEEWDGYRWTGFLQLAGPLAARREQPGDGETTAERRCCGSSLDADHQYARRTLNTALLVRIHTAAGYDGERQPTLYNMVSKYPNTLAERRDRPGSHRHTVGVGSEPGGRRMADATESSSICHRDIQAL